MGERATSVCARRAAPSLSASDKCGDKPEQVAHETKAWAARCAARRAAASASRCRAPPARTCGSYGDKPGGHAQLRGPCTNADTHTHARKHARARRPAHTQIHTRTRTRAICTRAKTHTYTHTRALTNQVSRAMGPACLARQRRRTVRRLVVQGLPHGREPVGVAGGAPPHPGAVEETVASDGLVGSGDGER